MWVAREGLVHQLDAHVAIPYVVAVVLQGEVAALLALVDHHAVSIGELAALAELAVVKHFLTSGSAPEQGYKDCVSLRKLGSRYGKTKLDTACERMLAFSSSPSIRTIATILKNGKDSDKPVETDNSSKYGITRGAAYWKKGGDGNA